MPCRAVLRPAGVAGVSRAAAAAHGGAAASLGRGGGYRAGASRGLVGIGTSQSYCSRRCCGTIKAPCCWRRCPRMPGSPPSRAALARPRAPQPADSASPLHAAMVESAFATVQVASQQAWEGLLQDLLQLYRGRLRQLDARTATPAGGAASAGSSDGAVGGGAGSRGSSSDGSGGGSPAGGPDLLLLSASRVQALLVVCVGSPEARAAAEAQIAAVDPPSRGVPMAKASAGCCVALKGTERQQRLVASCLECGSCTMHLLPARSRPPHLRPLLSPTLSPGAEAARRRGRR